VYRTKRRFVLGNLEAALSEEPRPGATRKLSGKEEALLVATACSSPPAGRARWTLELLAGEFIRLIDRVSISRETVRRRLAENRLKPWRKDMWCIPQVDAEYVARMEDVLDLYAEPPDPKRPVVCFDESPIQLIGEVRPPIPARPGQLERYDFEYKRNGTANLFVFLDVHRPFGHCGSLSVITGPTRMRRDPVLRLNAKQRWIASRSACRARPTAPSPISTRRSNLSPTTPARSTAAVRAGHDRNATTMSFRIGQIASVIWLPAVDALADAFRLAFLPIPPSSFSMARK
jgi:hypothetical protein